MPAMDNKCVLLQSGEYKLTSEICDDCSRKQAEIESLRRQLAVALGEISVLQAQLLRMQQHGYRREDCEQ